MCSDRQTVDSSAKHVMVGDVEQCAMKLVAMMTLFMCILIRTSEATSHNNTNMRKFLPTSYAELLPIARLHQRSCRM